MILNMFGERKMHYKPKLEELEGRQLLSVTSAIFTVDQNSSAIALSGDVSSSTILPQGTGSLTSNYTGSIVADWDLSAQTINFHRPGTVLSASITGNWQPLPGGGSGNAPANYGGKVTIVIFTANISLRNLAVTAFTANPLTLSGSGPYSFPGTQTLILTSGTADYNAGILGSGSTDLAGLSSDNVPPIPGTFEDLGNGSYRITDPINITVQKTVGSLLVTLHIQGQIVANAVLPVVNLTDGSGSSFDYATKAVGGAGPVPVEDPAAAVTRAPTANLTSMTVTLLNHPDDTAEFLSSIGYDFTNSGLTVTGYDPVSGQLVITGSADPSVYQDVLRSINYEDDSTTPDTSDRLIQFVVSDGVNTSTVRTTTVSVASASPSPPPGLIGLKPTRPPVVSLDVSVATSTSIPLVGTAPGFVMEELRSTEHSASRFSGGETNIPFDRMLASLDSIFELGFSMA